MRHGVAAAGLLSVAVLVCAAAVARAHWLRPEQVIEELRSAVLRERYGITQVTRHRSVPRLLVIRVDSRWDQVDASERRAAAEKWMAGWRHTVSQGIIAILDNGTDRSLVNFDANGRAVLTEPQDVAPPKDGS